jgi:hypothetical protein
MRLWDYKIYVGPKRGSSFSVGKAALGVPEMVGLNGMPDLTNVNPGDGGGGGLSKDRGDWARRSRSAVFAANPSRNSFCSSDIIDFGLADREGGGGIERRAAAAAALLAAAAAASSFASIWAMERYGILSNLCVPLWSRRGETNSPGQPFE